MNKTARQFEIRKLINTHTIANQDELRRELKKRGFKVTQATLSRDLHELGVSRVVAGNTSRYALQPAAETQILKPIVSSQILSIDANESLIVLKTLPGSASTVGEFIDVQHHPDIIGTVAGDNTLLVIPQSHRKTNAVIEFIRRKLIEGEE
jgi:transcriptional regulator of arginine metabolism